MSSTRAFFQPVQQLFSRGPGFFLLQSAQAVFRLAIDILLLTRQGAETGVAQQNPGLLGQMLAQLVDRPDRKSIAQVARIGGEGAIHFGQVVGSAFAGRPLLARLANPSSPSARYRRCQFQMVLGATASMAATSSGLCPRCSKRIAVARWRTSGNLATQLAWDSV